MIALRHLVLRPRQRRNEAEKNHPQSAGWPLAHRYGALQMSVGWEATTKSPTGGLSCGPRLAARRGRVIGEARVTRVPHAWGILLRANESVTAWQYGSSSRKCLSAGPGEAVKSYHDC